MSNALKTDKPFLRGGANYHKLADDALISWARQRVAGDWDGTNWATIEQWLLNNGNRTPEYVKQMTVEVVYQALATVTFTNATTHHRIQRFQDRHWSMDGDYLMPPASLRELADRVGPGFDTDKLKTLLDQYDLRNYPEDNRQSWTVNLAPPMPPNLKAKLIRPTSQK